MGLKHGDFCTKSSHFQVQPGMSHFGLSYWILSSILPLLNLTSILGKPLGTGMNNKSVHHFPMAYW